jgi:uncharacterized protein (TIGR02265 family)
VSAEKLVFEHAFDGLLSRAIAHRMTPQLALRIGKAGVQLQKKLLPAYPLPVWEACVEACAEEVFPGLTPNDAYFQLGRLFIDGYRQTLIGGAVLAMVRVVGPKRALQRATRSFRSADNYTDAKVEAISEKTMDLWVNEAGNHPTFTQGILAAALELTAPNVRVELRSIDGRSCVYRCSWS